MIHITSNTAAVLPYRVLLVEHGETAVLAAFRDHDEAWTYALSKAGDRPVKPDDGVPPYTARILDRLKGFWSVDS